MTRKIRKQKTTTPVRNLNRAAVWLAILFLPATIIALAVGYGYGTAPTKTVQFASGDQIEAARQDIITKYLASSSTECNDPTDPTHPSDRVAVFYKYLRVNRYANRAVIRGCNDIDVLLAKTGPSVWEPVLHLSLDQRQNASWQQACLIDDITRTDTEIRSENTSLDSINLKICQHLQKHNQILTPAELFKS